MAPRWESTASRGARSRAFPVSAVPMLQAGAFLRVRRCSAVTRSARYILSKLW